MERHPARPLTDRHVRNARVVASRIDILRSLPKGGSFCEVGVAYGDFSASVLDIVRPDAFIAIDIFTMHDYPDVFGFDRLKGGTHEAFYRRRFATQIESGVMVLSVGNSVACIRALPDQSMDTIYIDAWHSYEAVRSELQISKRKIKPDGVLILNDYTMFDYMTGHHYGVVQAVNEFMIEEQWEMTHFALHTGMYCDVAIRKFRD